jgi:clan AA aspartic protease
MGHVYADVKIAEPKRQRILERRMLVDTGATYACISHQMAQELGLHPELEMVVTLADGRKAKAGMALAYVEINGRESGIQLLIFDVSETVIGVFTLEALGLAVDPVSGELKPTRGFIARA